MDAEHREFHRLTRKGPSWDAVVASPDPDLVVRVGYDALTESFVVAVFSGVAPRLRFVWGRGGEMWRELATVEDLVAAAAEFPGGCVDWSAEPVLMSELAALQPS